MARLLVAALLLVCSVPSVTGFFTASTTTPRFPPSAATSCASTTLLFAKPPSSPEDPQVLASGFSQNMDLLEAIQEASDMALSALPPANDDGSSKIDLAVVSISSLYDGSASPATVVPGFLEATKSYGKGIQYLIGSSNGGYISSMANLEYTTTSTASSGDQRGDDDEKDEKVLRACTPVEQEGVPGVSVVYCILPDVDVKTFHVTGSDVPDDVGKMPKESWRESVGLSGFEEDEDGNTVCMLLPSPAFQNDLDDLLLGFRTYMSSGATVMGAIASTVSSLSRARLFRYDSSVEDCITTLADGCVGVAMTGDIEVQTMIAQGAKPVGGVYQIVKGEESTIQAIALDETATDLVMAAEEQDEDDLDDDDEDPDAVLDEKAKMAQAYQKARIPKPVLAEANFVMKTLSDDDQAFMRKALLVGLEEGGSIARTPSELARLAEGKGHLFNVHQVASAAMRDGSVTLSLGSVEIKPGSKMRFFVRENNFAKREVDALWMGYKKRVLSETVQGKKSFQPTGCFLFPTLDRGNKFFLGKSGYETTSTLDYVPSLPCVSGFFSNGVIGSMGGGLQGSEEKEPVRVHGSSSGYFLFGSKSGRPIFNPARTAASAESSGNESESPENAELTAIEKEDEKRDAKMKSFTTSEKAPRDERGELILKRREVHSGRAMTVSTVEWSVAEKSATPTSVLEGFMWDKETEVDRFRERVPLANLLSQCKLYQVDPSKPKPRDWIGPVLDASDGGSKFVIIPEMKRVEPISGSLRKRYDLKKLSKEFITAGVPAVAVNCDAVLFGGSLDDVTEVRELSAKVALEAASGDNVAVPPILASDLILYPYQLYKLNLAGADAVSLVAGSLAAKDLVYLTKIAQSLKMQCFLSVTSTAQLKALDVVAAGGVTGLIVSNRQLEDFSFDMTGQQALDVLQSDELTEFRQKHGKSIPIFVEGRVGIIEREGSTENYIQALKEAGAMGAIVGGGLVNQDGTGSGMLESLLQES